MRENHEEAISGLVLAKRERTPESLIRLSSDDRDQIKRADYIRAADSGLILFFALALSRLGEERQARVWTWTSGATTAKYDAGTASFRVTVGNILVLSDELPGREVMIPGQWCFAIHDAYRELLAREDAARRQDSMRRAGEQIAEMTAEV